MSSSRLANFKELILLTAINLKVRALFVYDYLRTSLKYYGLPSFAKIDTTLLYSYLFNNPFHINKRFLLSRGETDIYNYGETPLSTLEKICKESSVSSSDTLFELGCGRGRTCFWLRQFINCTVVGIDQVPEFIDRANQLKERYQIPHLEFRNEDILSSDFSRATTIYLYGSSHSDQFIRQLTAKLSLLPSGVKIISVSYPIVDQGLIQGKFEIMKCFPAQFPWGKADVYLSIRK